MTTRSAQRALLKDDERTDRMRPVSDDTLLARWTIAPKGDRTTQPNSTEQKVVQRLHGTSNDVEVVNNETSDSPVYIEEPVDETQTLNDDNTQTTVSGNDKLPVEFPMICQSDYETDVEFGDMYRYIQCGELTGNARRDKTILIMAEGYMIDQDDLLYRVDIPRQKHLRRLKPTIKRLCVPRQFRHDIISYIHDQHGHYAAQSLFHTLAARYFWKSMFSDATEYCGTCGVCQRTKINYNPKYAPLHTLPIPDEVGARFSMDHKPLCRTTNAGNSAILVIVEAFSGFLHLIPV